MRVLQEKVEEQLRTLPRRWLDEMLVMKLNEQGIKATKREREEIAEMILAARLEEDGVEVGKRRRQKLKLSITDADMAWLDKKSEDFLATLPDFYREQAETLSSTILRTLKRRWAGEWQSQRRLVGGFRSRLLKRWRVGLGLLRMLQTVAREFGDGVLRTVQSGKEVKEPRKFEVLVKLQLRAVQVTDEILCLLEGGLADGAMARWRTLNEIAGVALLIREHGEELAQRYLDHDIVESRKAMLQYQKYHVRLGHPPPDPREMKKVEDAYAAAITKYGDEFKNAQGWAAKHLKKANPLIAHILEASGIDHLGPYYKMASHSVHANPKGLSFKLSGSRDVRELNTGPSNAGLTDPGHSTAISLNQISSALMTLAPSLDTMVTIKIMQALEEEIGPALLAAQHELEADETEFLRKEAFAAHASPASA